MPPIPYASLCRKALRVHAAHPRRLAALVGRMTPPLRSTPITEASRYYGRLRPRPSIGILPRGVSHLSFPFASGERFSRSVPKPVLRSCRLYTGCHRFRKQVTPRFVLKPMVHLSFDSALGLTMRRRTVCFRSSSQYTPATPQGMTFARSLTTAPLNAAAPGGLKPAPASRLRKANSHLRYSTTGLPPVFVTHATGCPSSSGASRDRARPPRSSSSSAPQ